MYVITGGFGQTGSAVGHALLAAGQPIRLLVRSDDDRAKAWGARGAEIAVADLHDPTALTRAFEGAKGAYLMTPPDYGAPDLFRRARTVQAAFIAAVNHAQVPHVLALSSVGAHQPRGTGNIVTTHDFERHLNELSGDCTVLRAANFMENWAWSFQAVFDQGVLPSMLLPLSRRLPMVSTRDIGLVAAELLLAPRKGRQIVELQGPSPASPDDAASVLSDLLGRTVVAQAVPEPAWSATFAAMGYPPTTVDAFCAMYRGFNDGTVSFEGTHDTRHGTTDLRTALSACLAARPGATTSSVSSHNQE